MTTQTMQIREPTLPHLRRSPCGIHLLLQMTGEHELQSMESEVTAIAQSAHLFLFAAIPVESWNDALSWEAPAVWGKQGFGGKAGETLCFLTEQVIPSLKQQFNFPENVKIILGGYSLAGVCSVGLHPDRSVLWYRRRLAPLFGFRAGWSLNSGTQYRRSGFM